jgi:hypothetical protein
VLERDDQSRLVRLEPRSDEGDAGLDELVVAGERASCRKRSSGRVSTSRANVAPMVWPPISSSTRNYAEKTLMLSGRRPIGNKARPDGYQRSV